MADALQHIQQIPVERIRPNRWNPNVMSQQAFQELVTSIRQEGFLSEPLVRPMPDGNFELIDGEQRWRAAKEAGLTEIPCAVISTSELRAKIGTLKMNLLRGQHVPIKQALLVAEIAKDGVPIADLGRELGLEDQEIEDHQELLKLPDDIGATIELQAQMEERDALQVMTFVVHKPQAEIIDRALQQIEEQLDGKNVRGRALEYLAAEFLAGNPDLQGVVTTGQVTDVTGG